MKYIKSYKLHLNESNDVLSLDGLKENMTVKFKANSSKAISNYEIDISSKTGIITNIDENYVVIKLDEHMVDLDEWDNELIYDSKYEVDQLLKSIIVSNYTNQVSIKEEYNSNIHSISVPVSTLEMWIERLDMNELDLNTTIPVKNQIKAFLNQSLMGEGVEYFTKRSGLISLILKRQSSNSNNAYTESELQDLSTEELIDIKNKSRVKSNSIKESIGGVSKKIVINFPNGDTFEIPAEIIAEQRTKYYAENDGFLKGSEEWDAEFEQSMTSDELYDWIQNNTDWDDVKQHATKVSSGKDDTYDSMWSDAEFEVK